MPSDSRAPTILKLSCPDRVGLLARITGFFAALQANLVEVGQFTDPISGWFFTRVAIDRRSLSLETEALRQAFRPVAEELKAEWTIREGDAKARAVILVSRQSHCLADLLWRWRSGELAVEIPLVISNHEDLREMVEREGACFRHIPVTQEDRQKAFEMVEQEFRDAGGEVMILARYMQILPPELCRSLAGRILNIHHSFLPGFAGANPYRQAFARGVKLVGATCHYVTEELDAGPIIDQEVVRVEHFHSPEDLLRLGQDCERLALARGVRYHVEDRVLIHGNKTVVFRD